MQRSSIRAAPRARARLPSPDVACVDPPSAPASSWIARALWKLHAWRFSPNVSLRGFASGSGRPRASAAECARVEKAACEFCDRDAELIPQAALQGPIVLRAAENIANQIAKRGRVIQQLYHARSDRTAQEIAAEYLFRDVRGKFQISGKRCAQLFRIEFRLAGHDRLREQIARAQRVVKPFA